MATVLQERRPEIKLPAPARETGRWLTAAGVATLLVGVVAVAAAPVTTFFTVGALGFLAVLAAVFQAVYAFTAGQWKGFGLHMLLAVLYGVVGLYMLAYPLAGVVALTVAVGLMFTLSGAFRMAASLQARFPGWGWTLAGGIVTAALGLYVLRELPAISLVLLGTLFGVDMIVLGSSLIGIGAGLRRRIAL